jgi:hypothetical protein
MVLRVPYQLVIGFQGLQQEMEEMEQLVVEAVEAEAEAVDKILETMM